MKIWKVLEELSTNPEKKFKLKDGTVYHIMSTDVEDGYGGENYYIFETYYNSGKKMEGSYPGANFNGNLSSEDNWEEVLRKKISFQDALQLWLRERSIYCEDESGTRYFYDGVRDALVDQEGRALTCEQITMFDWYAEDGI